MDFAASLADTGAAATMLRIHSTALGVLKYTSSSIVGTVH